LFYNIDIVFFEYLQINQQKFSLAGLRVPYPTNCSYMLCY